MNHSIPQAVKPSGISPLALVVDDNELVQHALADMVLHLGYEALLASNADDAMQHLERSPHLELLICDVVLPGETNGAQLAQRIAKQQAGLKSLLISAFDLHELQQAVPTLPDIPVLQKPFSLQQLKDAIQNLPPAGYG